MRFSKLFLIATSFITLTIGGCGWTQGALKQVGDITPGCHLSADQTGGRSSVACEHVYVGAATPDEERMKVANEVITEIRKPSGTWSEVPAWITLDQLRANDRVELKSYKPNDREFLNKVPVGLRVESDSDSSLRLGLNRTSDMLDQLRKDRKVRAIIISSGFSPKANPQEALKVKEIAKHLALHKDKLELLCIVGVPGEYRPDLAALFGDLGLPVRTIPLTDSRDCFQR